MIPVQKGNVFSTGNMSKDADEILTLLTQITQLTKNRKLEELKPFISDSKGIYIDLKSWKSKEEFLEEVRKEDGYIDLYFYHTEKLSKEKGELNVRTVRDLLILSEGLKVDFHFETNQACEIKLRFEKNNEYETELNNPYFIKENGKWYLYRLF